MKPQLNRLPGVSTVVVQGGQEPEFQIQPDPAKLVQAQVTVPNILDAIAKSNLIDSPGLIEHNHQLVLGLVSGQAQTPARNRRHRGEDDRIGRAGDDSATLASVSASVKPVYTIVTANGKPAVLLNIYRQPDSNTVAVADEVHQKIAELRQTLPAGIASAAVLRPIGNGERIRSRAFAMRF